MGWGGGGGMDVEAHDSLLEMNSVKLATWMTHVKNSENDARHTKKTLLNLLNMFTCL